MATTNKAFDPEVIIKRTKGKMIMLYALVNGEEEHVASFFHDHKAKWVLDAIEDSAGVTIEDEDAPKPKKGAKKTAGKKTVKKGRK